MINVVLVDDERPALRGLEFLLRKYPEISVVKMYTDPLNAIAEIGEVRPQAVFLDINMPQLRGIDAASMMLEKSPGTDIIFITAYDQHAIEAFELHALDYIMKPVGETRLQKTIERLMNKKPVQMKETGSKLQIKCLGKFSVAWEGQAPIKWRTEKVKELFAFLICNRSRMMSKEEIMDKLWPEDSPDKAVRMLYNGIYYIRKAIEAYGIDREMLYIGSDYNIKLEGAEVDADRFYEFEKSCGRESIEELEQIAALYSDDFLKGEDYLWADIERQRLSGLYVRCLIMLSKKLTGEKQWDRAEQYLVLAYQRDPYEEGITELLLELYKNTGNKNRAIRHFNAYSHLIHEELGVKPGKRVMELIKF